METTLRKMGNSTGLIVPKAMLDQLGLQCGAKMELSVEGAQVIARPVDRDVREGWAEAARDIMLNRSDKERTETEEWLAIPYDSDFGWDGNW